MTHANHRRPARPGLAEQQQRTVRLSVQRQQAVEDARQESVQRRRLAQFLRQLHQGQQLGLRVDVGPHQPGRRRPVQHGSHVRAIRLRRARVFVAHTTGALRRLGLVHKGIAADFNAIAVPQRVSRVRLQPHTVDKRAGFALLVGQGETLIAGHDARMTPAYAGCER